MKRVVIAGVALALSLACVALAAESAKKPSTIRPVGSRHILPGCGCSFIRKESPKHKNDEWIFSSTQGGPAWMNIAGTDVKLEPLDPNTDGMLHRLGDGCVMRYRAEGISVSIEVRATRVCSQAKGDESCEVTKLDGKLSLDAHDTKEVVPIEGDCGC